MMVAAEQLRDCKVCFLFFFRLFVILCACVRCVLGVAALSVINRSQCVSCDFDKRRFGCFFFPRDGSWKCVETCLRCELERCVLGDEHQGECSVDSSSLEKTRGTLEIASADCRIDTSLS